MNNETNTQYTHWSRTAVNPYLTRNDLTALGEIVVIWGQIEAVVQHLIWGYCRLETHRGMNVTVGLNLLSKQQLLATLVEQYEPDARRRDVIATLLKVLEKLRPTRNAIVHGFWLLSAPIQYRKIASDPEGKKYIPAKVDLTEFAERSGKLQDALHHLNDEGGWRDAVKAVPDRPLSADTGLWLYT